MQTTPSSSATTASPGRITVPAMLTGLFTAPPIALPVPCALTNWDQTGKRAAVIGATSRTPVVVTSPRTPRAASEVVISSPTKPSLDGEVVVTTSRSPGRACSIATCSMRLSPGPHSTVSAVPAARAPGQAGRRAVPSRPVLPAASCTVATPSSPSSSTTPGSARGGSTITTGFTPAPRSPGGRPAGRPRRSGSRPPRRCAAPGPPAARPGPRSSGPDAPGTPSRPWPAASGRTPA